MSNIQTSKHSNNNNQQGIFPTELGWENFDKMFNNLRSHWPFQMMEQSPFKANEMKLSPSVDIKESKNSFDITAELPGLDADEVNLEISGNVLTISGEKKSESSKNDDNDYHVMERSYGYFKRSFTLPNSVEQERVEANFKKGVLHISLPKSEKAVKEQHKIPIKG